MKLRRQGIASTKPRQQQNENDDLGVDQGITTNAACVRTVKVDEMESMRQAGATHGDNTGKFPYISARGHRYIRVFYVWDPNAILAIPMKSRADAEMQQAWEKVMERLETGGFRPNFYFLDNEMSEAMKRRLKKDKVGWQLAPPGNHRTNVAERQIQTFKDHFIAGLASVDVVASSFEAELGGLFHNGQDGAYIRTILEEMGHPQPATRMVTDNLAANNIANDIGKQKRSKAIDMRFYWIQDRIKQASSMSSGCREVLTSPTTGRSIIHQVITEL